MGFYGNITNTSRTTFQFDRVYPSRQAMDDNCASDGIYAGRYVLIEYDTALSNADYDKGWYLVTGTDGKSIPYGSVNTCSPTNEYLYFNSPDATTAFLAADLQNIAYKVIYFDKFKHFTLLNKNPIYARVRKNGTYTVITWDQFKASYNLSDSEESFGQETMESLGARGIVHAHIGNGMAHIEDNSLFRTDNTEIYAVILPGAQYTYNTTAEFWTIQDTTFIVDNREFAYLNQIPNDASGNYLTNFNIDKSRYNTARGYDSTVWQKVYSNGTEKYVMVAELNTVVPSFGVSSDPPSLLPINPHFGADSTNVYYELHWQPNWGFRVKAANNRMMMPKVKPNGQLDLLDQNNIQSQYASLYARDRDEDDIYYPSDQLTQWEQTFEDNTLNHDEKRKTLYFNPSSQHWETNTKNEVPSAIYFNRSGFNSNKIAYSSDLISEESRQSYPSWGRYNENVAASGWTNEDNILLSPTGLSGNVYNLHDGSIDLKPQTDTQELSIMLPSIGDTMAQVWDLVYGGRNTTNAIATTNFRNKDIFWENAKGEPSRRGLRLTGIDGDEYNTAQVDTLAGAINTAHDLIGMIISSNTTEELEDINNLDVNRIYYDSDRHQYFRKHKTYTYTEVNDDVFEFNEQNGNELNQEKIDSGLYYEVDPETGEYVVATIYDPSKQYFLKEAKPQYDEVVIEDKRLVNFPFENYRWYQDYLSENSAILDGISDSELQKLRSDYILDEEYKEGKTYYDVIATQVTLSQNYLPSTYWYKVRQNDRYQFMLDQNETRTKDRDYYTFNPNALLSLKADRNYSGVYVPGVYYFKKTDGNFELDLSDYGDCNGLINSGQVEMREDYGWNYYLLNIIKSYDMTGAEVLYRVTYSYQKVPTLNENTFIVNTYYTYDSEAGKYSTRPAETYESGVDYYLRQTTYTRIEDTAQAEISIRETIPSGNLVVYRVGTYFLKNTNASGELIGFTELTRSDFLNDSSVYNKEIWMFGDEPNRVPPFKTLEEAIAANDIIKRQDNFYQENTYHYTRNGSYILDTSMTLTEGREYYTLQVIEQPDDLLYYEPGKYYVTSPTEDSYELAIDTVIDTDNTSLFIKNDYYVIEDTRGILPYGTKWNPNAAAVPDEITLATREDKWELTAIPGFSKTLGTLNGMILKMYQALEPYDTLTRESDNVSGVINQLKDLIARFETLKSKEIMVVDNYGRAHSAPIATSQRTSYNQEKETNGDMIDGVSRDKFPRAETVGVMEKKWVTINVDGDPENPIITVHHNFQPVKNRVNKSNMNIATDPYYVSGAINNARDSVADYVVNEDTNIISEDLNPLNPNQTVIAVPDANNKIELYTPIVDGMGHVVGSHIETKTLPYGFRAFNIQNHAAGTQEDPYDDEGSTVFTTTSQGVIIADNTQDKMDIKAVDKWIRLTADPATDTITIAHKLHTPNATQTAARATNFNIDGVATTDATHDNILIHEYEWDAAGHRIEDHLHTYTLPYGFKTFVVANEDVTDNSAFTTPGSGGSIIADNTQDTFTFKTTDRWLRFVTDPSTDTLTISHKKHTRTAEQSAARASNLNTDNVASALDSDKLVLHDIVWDDAAHMLEDHEHTWTLPYGFKTFTIVNQDTTDESDFTTPGSEGSIVAENTQDTLTFKTVDRWLRFVTDPATDTLTIAHKQHTLTAAQSAARASNLNADGVESNSNNDKLVLHDYVWDGAKHMLEDHPHTWTLPYGFKFIATDSASEAVTDLTHAAVTIAAESTQDTVTFKSANIWMKMSANATDDSVTFGHLVRAIDVADSTSSDLNVAIGETPATVNNQVNIQDITHDEAGHVRARKNHIYTLPYDFKFVTTIGTTGDPTSNGTAIATAALPTTDVTTAAINTQDILTINPGNAWIKAAVNQNNRTLTIYHYVAPIDKVDSAATDFNNIPTGVFSLKDITHDDAGHVTAYKTHQYTLPYGFKTFTHSNNSGVTDLAFENDYANPAIVATTVVDSFAFAAVNKWIRLKANGKTLSISHLVNNFTPTEDTASLEVTSTATTTFKVIESISKDEAGHLSAINSRTFTMPNNFGTINITNSNNNTTELSSNTTGITADCTKDTITFAAADRWILLAGDAEADKITIGHALPDNTYTYDKGQTANASLNYGDSFKVVHPKADKFGHIGVLDEYTITIPSISLTNETNTSTANVLTGIGLNTTTGAFTYTQANVSELQLTNFNYNSSTTSASDLETGLTINEAFARLQKKIYDEVTATTGARDVAIKAAVESLDSSLSNNQMGKTLTGITITDGKITASTFGDISILASQVTVNNDTNFDARYYTETEINTTIQGLVHTANGALGVGKTITALTEVDGKISYTVSDISITSSQVSDLSTTITNAINTLDVSNTITSGEVHLMKSLSEADGKISYTSEALAWSHISPLLPTGNDAFLTVGTAASTYLTQTDAASTYEPKAANDNPYVTTNYLTSSYYTKDDIYSVDNNGVSSGLLSNFIKKNATFNYNPTNSYQDNRMTVEKLIERTAFLEGKLVDLLNLIPDTVISDQDKETFLREVNTMNITSAYYTDVFESGHDNDDKYTIDTSGVTLTQGTGYKTYISKNATEIAIEDLERTTPTSVFSLSNKGPVITFPWTIDHEHYTLYEYEPV